MNVRAASNPTNSTNFCRSVRVELCERTGGRLYAGLAGLGSSAFVCTFQRSSALLYGVAICDAFAFCYATERILCRVWSVSFERESMDKQANNPGGEWRNCCWASARFRAFKEAQSLAFRAPAIEQRYHDQRDMRFERHTFSNVFHGRRQHHHRRLLVTPSCGLDGGRQAIRLRYRTWSTDWGSHDVAFLRMGTTSAPLRSPSK